ncbi:hypothetical protein [Pseudomonas sp. PA-3-6E]|uniref:hypothetical protein n=1 Tax=Pseudomonas sp. PA-3-6E TaxID=2665474 RepID=UPI001F379521|nr:hypothetical protein [Pseudomonas sp. PA-3-6E]MCF5517576.1 hypothetical protein [Pseudomonas sp. PA-3-6E]
MSELSKRERLLIFMEQLGSAGCVGTKSEAFKLVETLLDKVEDDHSGQPKNYKDTGQRMYLWDFTKWVHDDSGLSSIVLKNHMLSLYEDGSIKIEILLGSGPITVFSKSGMTATI